MASELLTSIALRRKCTRCRGDGTIRGGAKAAKEKDREAITCPNCDGRGEVATSSGLEVLAFLDKFENQRGAEVFDTLEEDRERITDLTERLERIEFAWQRDE